MPAGHVVHTVGPIWGDVEEPEAVALLASCYRSSLALAREVLAKSVAFPNISTGVYHFPKALAAETAVEAVSKWVESDSGTVQTIFFVCFDPENLELYRELLGV
jgi:O-acetyl-ADP-ribose deacetylase (regulator of RNase III)